MDARRRAAPRRHVHRHPGGQECLAPLIATALLGATDGYDLIALYMAAMVLITIVTAFVSPDPYGDSLRTEAAASARPRTSPPSGPRGNMRR